MKTLLLSLLFSTSIFATTFTTSEELSVRNGDYILPALIDVKILDVNPHTDTAEIKVNGKVLTYKLKFLRSEVDAYENIYTYSTSLGSVLLSDGSACDEHEEVSFVLVLAVEDEPRDPHSSATYKAESLSAIYSYSYDLCHSPLATKVINYK